ncbi:MAG: M48 family metallopeptidase [Methylotenera sp.]|nr:M48 family metallopeptidase [Oligoflexia bacterium]
MSSLLIVLLSLLILISLIDAAADFLNLRSIRSHPEVPKSFEGYYDPEKYLKSQDYLRARTRFDLIGNLYQLILMIGFILLGGFNEVDLFARRLSGSSSLSQVFTGLIFVGTLSLARGVSQIPFSLYSTFVIEERFGFNRTSLKTFMLDHLKGIVLGVILGGLAFSGLILFFEKFGPSAWLPLWVGLSLFQVLILFLAPVLIMPLFFKFSPLPAGPLKEAIEAYARKENFVLSGIFLSDASTRSTKTNAFFTGFGKFRRLVLFDTLIKAHSTEELLAVVAHEVGHFKRNHIFKFTALSIFMNGIMIYLFSRFLDNSPLFEAFRMEHLSIHASIVFISIFISPAMKVISVFTQKLSRRFEFEADTYSVQTYRHREALISALKRLSAENLSSLFPHPFKVLLEYSHPPVLQRIHALQIAPDGHD